jgi:hypothetical protein
VSALFTDWKGFYQSEAKPVIKVHEDKSDTSSVLAANEQRVNIACIGNGSFAKLRGTVIADSNIGGWPGE